MQQLTLKVGGMSCGHCVTAVAGALKNLDGVAVERVDIGEVKLSFDSGRVSPDEITRVVEEEGYSVLASA